MKKKLIVTFVILVVVSPILWWFQLPPFNMLALGVCPAGWSYETGFTGADFYAMKCEKNQMITARLAYPRMIAGTNANQQLD